MKVFIAQCIPEIETAPKNNLKSRRNQKNASRGKHNPEYNYHLKVEQKFPSGSRIHRIYAHEKDKYLIYSAENSSSPNVTAENKNLLTEDTGIRNELQIRDYRYNKPQRERKFNETYLEARLKIRRCCLCFCRKKFQQISFRSNCLKIFRQYFVLFNFDNAEIIDFRC